MADNKEQLTVILVGRGYLYQLLQSLFGNEPNLEIINQLSADITKDAISLLFNDSRQEVTDFQSLIENAQDGLAAGANVLISNLRGEYTKLFLGPAPLPSPPWESVHKSGEKLLLQKETLAVRIAYRRNGFISKAYPHEPDDHIGIELDFMYRLSAQTTERLEVDDLEKMSSLIKEQQNFLDEHLLTWGDKFAAGLKKHDADSFYTITAEFLVAFLNVDRDVLTALHHAVEIDCPGLTASR
jgi:TorA maturation chaperone TorD